MAWLLISEDTGDKLSMVFDIIGCGLDGSVVARRNGLKRLLEILAGGTIEIHHGMLYRKSKDILAANLASE